MYNSGTYLFYEVIVVGNIKETMAPAIEAVKQFAMPVIEKLKAFLATCTYVEFAIMGVIVLIPILAIILAVAGRKARRRRRRQNVVYVDAPVKSRRVDDYYRPRKRRVRYVKTYAAKAMKKRPAQQTKMYCKMDQATLMATGLFGIGLGMMVQKSAANGKMNMYRF